MARGGQLVVLQVVLREPLWLQGWSRGIFCGCCTWYRKTTKGRRGGGTWVAWHSSVPFFILQWFAWTVSNIKLNPFASKSVRRTNFHVKYGPEQFLYKNSSGGTVLISELVRWTIFNIQSSLPGQLWKRNCFHSPAKGLCDTRFAIDQYRYIAYCVYNQYYKYFNHLFT